jgi:DNA-binding MarR family transcriptional regulator
MEHRSPEINATLSQAAESLFRLGRLFSRVAVPTLVSGHTARALELSRILIVQAVETLQTMPEQEATIGAIAQQLTIDPSTASRLVADAIRDGYLVRGASPTDSRRVQLDLTEAGRTLAQSARAYQMTIFHQVTSDWSDQERAEFARLFVRFVEAVSTSVQATAAPNDQR